MQDNQFDIPVVVFMFKRPKAIDVVKRIREIQPKKLYLIADQGRNEDEKALVEKCRRDVEAVVDWDCDLIKYYAEENRGVYHNIAGGAKWVLSQEKWAIFLEDDNLPEVSFFRFCKEMLEKFENDSRILWICGTNYLGKYTPKNNASYVFTRHMLPCGWASWQNKFERFYDGELEFCNDYTIMERVGDVYCNKSLYKQYRNSWMSEYNRIKSGKLPKSWDYQMDLSIKANNLFGICPCNNQIKNIGVDEFSEHGGKSFASEMTRRFCGMDSYPIEFPLNHPKSLLVDSDFEEKIAKIMLMPWSDRVRMSIIKCIKRLFNIPKDISLKQFLRKKR